MKEHHSSALLFKHMDKTEKEYFVTFFNNPKLFSKGYYVKESIFKQKFIGTLMKIIETLFQDKRAVTTSNIFTEMEKINKGVMGFESLNMLVKSVKPIDEAAIPNTINEIKANKARYELYQLATKTIEASADLTKDISELVMEASTKISELQEDISIDGDDFDDIIAQIISDATSVHSGEKLMIFETGVKEIDKKIPFVMNNITLIGGPAKAGKSRFLLWLIKILMDNNPDVFAVNWYSFEEDSAELGRKFVASEALLRDSEITGKERPLTDEDLGKIITASKKFENHVIKIEPQPRTIDQVSSEFQIFTKKNSDREPILIIDNLLLLDDPENSKRDDHIMNTINRIKQKTKAMIFIVHHFNDQQQGDERKNVGYRPILKHLKGQESYRRVPKVILLINYPYKYKELAAKYKNEKDILKYMFIVDVAAIRDMPDVVMDDSSSEEDNLIHMYASLDYNIFCPLSGLY